MTDTLNQFKRSGVHQRPRLSGLPVLPTMTMEILKLADDPHATVDDLNHVISRDPAMSCRILRVVNSSFYGLSRQVASVQRAIVILGITATRNLAVIASMVKVFEVTAANAVHKTVIDDIWRHSTCTAAASKMIADVLNHRNAEELFLAGLIHDIGIIAELHAERTLFTQALQETAPDGNGVPSRGLCDVEFEIFGDDHQGLGSELCEIWRFPEFLGEITGHHHRPLTLNSSARKGACIIAVADLLTASLSGNFRLDFTSLEIPDEILSEISLSRTDLEKIRERMMLEMDDICNVFS